MLLIISPRRHAESIHVCFFCLSEFLPFPPPPPPPPLLPLPSSLKSTENDFETVTPVDAHRLASSSSDAFDQLPQPSADFRGRRVRHSISCSITPPSTPSTNASTYRTSFRIFLLFLPNALALALANATPSVISRPTPDLPSPSAFSAKVACPLPSYFKVSSHLSHTGCAVPPAVPIPLLAAGVAAPRCSCFPRHRVVQAAATRRSP
jgi:hypothetical protein